MTIKRALNSQYYLPKMWLSSMLLTVLGTVIKNIDWISKTRHSINNLTDIKDIGTILLFLMLNQILSTFTLCLLCYHFSVLSENKQFSLIVWVIPVWIIINFSVCLGLHVKILIVWMKPSIFRHLRFLISNFWCHCYWLSRAHFTERLNSCTTKIVQCAPRPRVKISDLQISFVSDKKKLNFYIPLFAIR